MLGATTMFIGTHVTALPPARMMTNVPIAPITKSYTSPVPVKSNPARLKAYHAICDRWTEIMNPDPYDAAWRVHRIVQVSNKEVKGNRSIFFKAEFNNGHKAWLRGDTMQEAEPFTVVNHAVRHGYHKDPGFEWINEYIEAEKEFTHLLKIFNVKSGDLKK